MTQPVSHRTLLAVRAIWRLALFDAMLAVRGFRSVYRNLSRGHIPAGPKQIELESAICRAVTQAASFYWKPVRCLQRSAVTVSLLRAYGIDARVVIGYRPAPLFSHAWVEVEGRVVGGSPAYQRMLCPLARI